MSDSEQHKNLIEKDEQHSNTYVIRVVEIEKDRMTVLSFLQCIRSVSASAISHSLHRDRTKFRVSKHSFKNTLHTFPFEFEPRRFRSHSGQRGFKEVTHGKERSFNFTRSTGESGVVFSLFSKSISFLKGRVSPVAPLSPLNVHSSLLNHWINDSILKRVSPVSPVNCGAGLNE